MQHSKTVHTTLLVALFLLLFVDHSFSQILPPPIAPPPNATPIDGGLSIVMAICAGYGAKRIFNKQSKK